MRDFGKTWGIVRSGVAWVGFVAVLSALFFVGLVSPGSAGAERVLRNGVIVSFDGGITPKALPRERPRPITAHLSGRVRAVGGGPLPKLQRLQIDINRNAVINTRGLPACPLRLIENALLEEAMANCGRSRIGGGFFGVRIALPDQKMTQSQGRVLAFHSRIGGRRAVLMHVVTRRPAAVAITIPLIMHRLRGGEYGERLISPPLSKLISRFIYTTDFSFSLGRVFGSGANRRGYLSAACRAPKGLNGGSFALARATYTFRDGRRMQQSLIRNCRVAAG
jgi:hypothetical protein